MTEGQNKSFWKTLPGILTGIAAIITALTVWYIYNGIVVLAWPLPVILTVTASAPLRII